ncbi:MAG: PH domain-containing protein [Thermoanaerobaculia bacterium]|nr:PH domain-containing protein [Thermoanaerobaculia bacterium]
MNDETPRPQIRVESIERPHPNLFKYYLLQSIVLGPFFFLVLIPRYFRYHTLRYRFDREGVSMRWGVLFRREISLNYARIQDIHLSSNLFERWLGLARIEIQTASGSASAEMTIEGVQEFDEVRNFLYSKMRGASDEREPAKAEVSGAGTTDELATILREIAVELRAIREQVERTR